MATPEPEPMPVFLEIPRPFFNHPNSTYDLAVTPVTAERDPFDLSEPDVSFWPELPDGHRLRRVTARLPVRSTTSESSDSRDSSEGYFADVDSELEDTNSLPILILPLRLATKAMQNGSAEAKDPSGFLSEIIGGNVTVKLNSGIVYKGELQSVDGYMNIALENCKEFVDGKMHRNYGDVFLRGNNVMYICAT